MMLESEKTILIHVQLPSDLWPEVIVAASYIPNRLPIKILDCKISHKAWYNKEVDLAKLCVYGYNAYMIDYHIKSNVKIALCF